MQSQTEPSIATAPPSPIHSTDPKGYIRCRAHNRAGSRCRLHVKDPATGLCFRHAGCAARTPDMPSDSTDLSAELFAAEKLVLDSEDDINVVLSNVVALVAQGRLSSRRAAVITYALSLILRSIIAQDRKAANEPPQIIFDAPRPNHDPVEPAACTENKANAAASHGPKDCYEAVENYARLRS